MDNKINDVMNIMEEIKYGWLDINNNIHTGDMNQIANCYRVSSPEEVLKNKIGTCFDQVELERELLKGEKELVSYAVYTNHMVHTFITFRNTDEYIYFEHSSPKLKGTYSFKEKTELLKFVVYGFMSNHKIKDKNRVSLIQYEKLKQWTTFSEIEKIFLKEKKIFLD